LRKKHFSHVAFSEFESLKSVLKFASLRRERQGLTFIASKSFPLFHRNNEPTNAPSAPVPPRNDGDSRT
jgi:hypothetical protein